MDILLKAFSRLPEKLTKSTMLQIVGYPKIPIEPYKILARELGTENRTFWDPRLIEEKEVATYFASAYAIILPYRQIDQSGVLMVALAFGKPILASRVGGLEETIINGIHGFLFEPNDVDSPARYMAIILEDENKWSLMAREVERLAAENLSCSNIA